MNKLEQSWETYYGVHIRICDLSHQHLSNIIHYYKLIVEDKPHELIYEVIETKFGGIILPYHPTISFVSEINQLIAKDYTDGKPDSDIIVNGKWVGKIKYS